MAADRGLPASVRILRDALVTVMADQLDTVVRFHDVRRLPELVRCIFSLAVQTYRPLRIILTLQRFSVDDLATTKAALEPLFDLKDMPALSIINWNEAEPVDARAALLNVGVQAAQGRYLAFLDFDDVLYPEAYELLVARLKLTGAVIAFAKVRVIGLHVYQRFFYPSKVISLPVSGSSLADLFRVNFCPLHSYVIDRSQVSADILWFVPTLIVEEDYNFLLRICASLSSDFALTLMEINIGDYYFKTEDSNMVSMAGLTGEARDRLHRAAKLASDHWRRTILVSAAMQRSLGLADVREPRTVQQTIDCLPAYR